MYVVLQTDYILAKPFNTPNLHKDSLVWIIMSQNYVHGIRVTSNQATISITTLLYHRLRDVTFVLITIWRRDRPRATTECSAEMRRHTRFI